MKRIHILATITAALSFISCQNEPRTAQESPAGLPRSTGLFVPSDVTSDVLVVESGIVERCDIVGLPRPVWTDTWTVNAGERIDYPFGTRPDGSASGSGFLGPLRKKDGSIVTELPALVRVDEVEMHIPTLVSTLTASEVQFLLDTDFESINWYASPGVWIRQKAVIHARQRRSAGLSVFANSFSNRIPLFATLSRTNATASFGYTVTNELDQVFTGTIRTPPITGPRWIAYERTLDSLIPFFVSMQTTNIAEVFDKLGTFPMESKAGLFAREGIGLVDPTSLTTNAAGWITGGRSAWKAMDPTFGMSNQIILAGSATDRIFILSGFANAIINGSYRYSGGLFYGSIGFVGSYWKNENGAEMYWSDEAGWTVAGGGDQYFMKKTDPVSGNIGTDPVIYKDEWMKEWTYPKMIAVKGAVSTVATGWNFRIPPVDVEDPEKEKDPIPGGSGHWGYECDFLFFGPSFVVYTAPTNAIGSAISVTISGVAMTNASATNYFYRPDVLTDPRYQATETIDLSAAGTSGVAKLTKQWFYVKEITISDPNPVLGKTVEIIGQGVQLGLTDGARGRIFAGMIDERKRALNRLKWKPWTGTLAWETNLTVMSGWGTNHSGYAAGWWEDVKDQATARWATNGATEPESYSMGIREYLGFYSVGYAFAQRAETAVIATNVPATWPRSGELFARFDHYPSTNYYNPDFDGVAETTTVKIFDFPLGSETNLVSSVFGDADAGPDAAFWPDEPLVIGIPVYKGYRWDQKFLILKYDIPDL